MNNNTRFKDGRLGIGRTPIFPLDVSGNTRIEGDLVLKGTIADGSGVPIYFGHAGVTSTDGSNNIYHIGINRAIATDANFPLDVSGNINIYNGSLYIDGEIAEFSNWTDIGETEESGIYRNSKVAIGKTTANHILDVSGTVNIDGDILLNGTTMEPNPSVPALQAYTDTGPTWKNETIVTTVALSSAAESSNQALTASIDNKADKASPEFSGNVGIGKAGNASYALDILGDVNITSGALKLNGSTPVYSNWIVSGDDIYRDSKVTIGTTTVQNYQLYVNGDSHVQGTLSATTLDGNLEWSKIQNPPTTIALSQSNAIVTNTDKVSSQWITNSNDIHYNTGNVGIGTDSPQSQLQIGDFTGTPHLTLAGKNNSATSSGIYFTDNDAGENPINYGMGIQFDSLNNILNIIGDDNGDGTTDKLMTIMRANGNVGIGTTIPGDLLHIESGESETRLRIKNTASGGGSVIRMQSANNLNSVIWQDDNDKFVVRASDGIPLYLGANNVNDHMVIATTGNVGIGTTSPDSKLHVNGNITLDACRTGSSYPTGSVGGGISFRAGAAYVPDSSNGAYNCSILTYAHDQSTDGLSINGYDGVSFCTGSSTRNERMRINSSGNVGIGTTNPGAKLEVNRETTAGVIAEFKSNTAGNSGIMVSPKTGSDGDGYIELRGGNSSTHGKHVFIGCTRNGSDTYNSNIVFKTRSDAYSSGYEYHHATEHMRIQYNGNVGIGTPSPRELLNISGSSSSSTDILYPLMINNQAMHVGPNIGGGVGIKFHMYDNGNTEYRYSAIVGISEATFSNKTALGFYTNDNELSAPLERMRIDNEGNVGIGTTSPDRPLQINTDQQASIQLERKTGSGYARIGINTQFSIGEYNNKDIPWAHSRSQMNAFFIEYSGGESTWDNEGAYLWMNGDYTAFANTGDCNANGGVLHYYDSDIASSNAGSGNGVWYINYDGSITNNSDIRLKENIRYFDDEYNISNIKEKYSQIKFCKYNYKKPLKDPSGVKRDYYGIIAQELELLFPETICQDNNGIRSFKNNVLQCITSHITTNLIKENKELKTKVANLEAKLQSIEQRLAFAGF